MFNININIHPAQLEITPEPTAAVITDVSEPYLSQLESSLISFQEDQPSVTATTLATKATVRARNNETRDIIGIVFSKFFLRIYCTQ